MRRGAAGWSPVAAGIVCAPAAVGVIAADVMVVATLSCRIAADYGTWHGVDVTSRPGRTGPCSR